MPKENLYKATVETFEGLIIHSKAIKIGKKLVNTSYFLQYFDLNNLGSLLDRFAEICKIY